MNAQLPGAFCGFCHVCGFIVAAWLLPLGAQPVTLRYYRLCVSY
jgi:hypothetical protein